MTEVVHEYRPGEWAEPLEGVRPRILDIGANVGCFALLCTQVFRDCQLECFEPHPESFALLKANLRGVPQATAYRCAVVGQELPGELHDVNAGRIRARGTLYDGRTTRLGASLFKLGWQGSKTFRVPLFPAKALPACDVFKVDTEGAELEIASAYKHGARVRLALCEWHRVEDVGPLEALFSSWGLVRLGAVWVAKECGVMRWARRSERK